MSDESYRILDEQEINKYIDCPWFRKECKFISGTEWAVPEKYLIKDLDKKKFYSNLLQELLNGFDFERVHKCMEVLDWSWTGVNGIPEEEDMILVVKNLYESIEKRILEGKYCYCATGGFKLTFNPDEDNELSLVFAAENYSVYGD